MAGGLTASGYVDSAPLLDAARGGRPLHDRRTRYCSHCLRGEECIKVYVLADRLGVERRTIWRWMKTGRIIAQYPRLDRLATRIGRHVAEIWPDLKD